MSVPLTINGVTFQYPQEFDKHWGPTLTNWSIAVTNALSPLTGGYLTLSPYPSTGISFANATNTGFLALTINGSNQLTFNGTPISASASLTDGHIYVGNALNHPTDVAMTGDITISDTGLTTLGALKVSDSQIATLAGIALTKLASTTPYYWYVANASGVLTPIGVTASKVIISDANGLPSASSVSTTTLGYLDATSSVQGQLNGITGSYLPLAGGTLSGNLSLASNQITGIGPATLLGQALSFGNALNGTTLTLTGQLLGADGTVNAPEYSFTNAPNAGMYHQVFSPIAAPSADWNTTTHKIAVSPGMPSQTIGQLTTTGTLPAGLSLATNYWLIVYNDLTFALADSLIHQLQVVPVVFTTQGTGTHTFTPTAVKDIGLVANGVQVARAMLQAGSDTGTLVVGDDLRSIDTTQVCEVIHAEGHFDGGSGVPAAADIIVIHRDGKDARLIAGSSNGTLGDSTYAYLIGHGTNVSGTYLSGAPFANSCELRSQNSTNGTVFTNDGQNYYFQNDMAGTPTLSFTVLKTGIVPYRASADPTPIEEGQMYYNLTANQMRYWNGSSWHGM